MTLCLLLCLFIDQLSNVLIRSNGDITIALQAHNLDALLKYNAQKDMLDEQIKYSENFDCSNNTAAIDMFTLSIVAFMICAEPLLCDYSLQLIGGHLWFDFSLFMLQFVLCMTVTNVSAI